MKNETDQLKDIEKNIKSAEHRLKEYDRKNSIFLNPKSRGMILFALVLFAIVLVLTKTGTEGFATLENAEVFAGKDVYEVSDMAHLFVVPSDANYEIEVYDPEGSLVANGLNFKVDKEGRYTVQATLTIDNEIKKIKTEFEVIFPKQEEILSEEIDNALQPAINEESEDLPEEPIYDPLKFTITKINETQTNETKKNNFTDDTLINNSGIKTDLQNNAQDNNQDNQSLLGEGAAITGDSILDVFKGEEEPEKKKSKDIDINFTDDDVTERFEKDDSDNNVRIVELDKEGINVKIKGARKKDIKSASFRNEQLHVESIPIEEAVIEIPHDPLPSITRGETLFIKEDNESEFKQAIKYEKNGKVYNKITTTPTHYIFSVEHFTTYDVNISNITSLTLTECLIQTNATGGGLCQINEPGTYSINDTYNFYYNLSGSISIINNNVTMDCAKSTFSTNVSEAIALNLQSSINNIVIQNCSYIGGKPITGDISTGARSNFTIRNINITDCSTIAGCFAFQRVESATITNMNIINSGTSQCVLIKRSANITINDSNFINCSTGIHIQTLGFPPTPNNNIQLNNVNVSQSRGHGVQIYLISLAAGTLKYVNIRDSTIEFSNRSGLVLETNYTNITHVIFRNNTYHGIILNGSYAQIVNNTFENNGNATLKYADVFLTGNQIEGRNNITGNIFNNTFPYANSSVPLIQINSTINNTTVWLNSFLYNGNITDNSPTGSSSYCVNGYGNFYHSSITSDRIMAGDCGQSNWTNPAISSFNYGSVMLNWTPQSSQEQITYAIQSSTDGSAWTAVGTTTNLYYNHTIDENTASNTVQYRIIPAKFGVNGTINTTGTLTSRVGNNVICSNIASCQFQNLADCLFYNNNTGNTCTINNSWTETINSSYLFMFTSTDMINIVNNATNYTYLDFNKSVFYGDDGEGDRLVTYTGGGTQDSTHNSTIYNLTSVDWSVIISQSFLSKTSQGFIARNINSSSPVTSAGQFITLKSSNMTVDNLYVSGGSGGEGLLFTDAGDSRISNVDAINIDGAYNIYVSSGLCNNIKFDKINASRNILITDIGYGFYFDANGCYGGNISNSTFAFNNGTGLHWEAFNSTIVNNTFMNNTKAGIEFDIGGSNGTIDVLNNTFENNGNQEPTIAFLASYSRTNVSGTLMDGGSPVMLPSNLDTGSVIIISSDNTDVSTLADGINNIARWSIDVPAAGLPMGTVYVVMPPAMSCAAVAGAYGGTCYGEQNDYFTANGAASNYTIAPEYASNQTISVIQGDTNPAYLRYRKQSLKTLGDINAENGYILNISNNVFNDNYDYGSEDITRIINFGANNHVTAWLNRFYYNGEVNNTNTGESSFCYDGEGNFYIDTFTKTFGNTECGQANITVPVQGENYSFTLGNLNTTWNTQSSISAINYSTHYSNDSGTTYYFLNSSPDLSYVWDISTMPELPSYLFRLIPFDGVKNGTTLTATFKIYQTKPTLASADLLPNSPNTTNTLNCTFTPTDNETVTYSANVSFYNASGAGIPLKLFASYNLTVTNNTKASQDLSPIGQQNKTEIWSCSVVLDDGAVHSNQVNSTVETVVNAPPEKINLSYPSNGNATVFNRTVFFIWNATTDDDEDPITYILNVTNAVCPNLIVGGITNTNYSFGTDLCVDNEYSWYVYASDGTDNSTQSNTWTFTLASNLIITLTNNSVNFSSMALGENDNTSYDAGPNPFVIQNDGNVYAAVLAVSANKSLWNSVGLNTAYFQFKANNRTTEPGSFDWVGSATTWLNFKSDIVENTTVIATLNYSDHNDTAEIDVRIEVPPAEPSGNKYTNIVFRGNSG